MEILQQPDASQQSGIAAIELTPDLARKRRSQLRIIFDRFVRNRAAVVGVIVLSIIILMAIFAPVITHRYSYKDFEKGFEAIRSGNSGKVVLDFGEM